MTKKEFKNVIEELWERGLLLKSPKDYAYEDILIEIRQNKKEVTGPTEMDILHKKFWSSFIEK